MKTNLSFCLMTTTLLCEEFNPETFCGAADSFKSPSKNAVEAAKQEMATEREQLAKDEAKSQLIIDEQKEKEASELCEQRRSEIRNLNKAYPKGENYCNAAGLYW